MMPGRRNFCRVLAVALAGIAAVGCQQSATSPSELVGETWRLLAIERSDLPSLAAPADRTFTLEFQDGGRLRVRADCNSCSGTFASNASQLTIAPLACTRAFCGSDSLDTLFLQALSEAKSARRHAGELTIESANVSLRFTRQ